MSDNYSIMQTNDVIADMHSGSHKLEPQAAQSISLAQGIMLGKVNIQIVRIMILMCFNAHSCSFQTQRKHSGKIHDYRLQQ